ncbi:MerR family transcriptional regulator [Microbacterium sp. GXS0129]|uniref:MerR family transcriptional regulator n=1 Tax=Microbacterium sp. GXS0129 TaxID=3377836 RepID=UPI00383BDD3B
MSVVLIGDVARHSGISARMLRHYDRIGLVSASGRTTGGYREYSDEDMRRLLHVESLRSLGLSLAEISEVIDDREFDPAIVVTRVVEQTRRQIVQAQELVHRLEGITATEPRSWDDVLRTIHLMHRLEKSDASARQRLALRTQDADQRDLPVLIDAMLREEGEDAAGALQWAIARSGDAAVAVLADALVSDDPGRRRRAFDALVKIDSPAARQVIRESASHPDERVRRRAIIARAEDDEADSMAALVELIRSGQGDVDASDALAALADRTGLIDVAVNVVAQALSSAEAPARRRLAAALVPYPPAVTRPVLESLLDDEDRATALTAQYVLDSHGAGESP